MSSQDGFRWRVRSYSFEESVLSGAELDMLSERHDLDRDDLNGLAAVLTILLDDRRYIVSKDLEVDQRDRGRTEVEAAIADILAAETRLARARRRLDGIAFKHPFPGTGMRNPVLDRIDALEKAKGDIYPTRLLLEAALRNDSVALKQPFDKRQQRIQRRQLVCRALFDFWSASGRPVTYTTVPLTSERTGPLPRFVNDVVEKLTDPPAVIGGETIMEEIKAYGAAGGGTKPTGPVRKARRVDEEATRLLALVDDDTGDLAARLVQLIAMRDAVERRGSAEQRVSDLRLAVLLSEGLVERSRDPSQKGESLKELALVMTALGELTWDLDMLQDALAVHAQALTTLSGDEHRLARAGAQLNRAMTLQVLETLRGEARPSTETLQAYAAALDGLDPSAEPRLCAHVRMSLAVAIARRATRPALAEAEGHLCAALDLAKRGGDARQLANVLHNLALCQKRLSHTSNNRDLLNQAKRHAEAALVILRDLDAPDLLAMAEALADDIVQERIDWPARRVPRPSRTWVKPRPRRKGKTTALPTEHFVRTGRARGGPRAGPSRRT